MYFEKSRMVRLREMTGFKLRFLAGPWSKIGNYLASKQVVTEIQTN